MRARSALFTLFGDVVRPAGGEAWLSTITECMETVGFTPQATRTALHRLTGEGWVEPRRHGRYAAYRLTARGVDRLEEAAARIYRLRAAGWDGAWRVLVGPDIRRDDQLSRALAWTGFGRLSDDVWISPHDHGDRVERLLRGAGLADRAHGFTTAPHGDVTAEDRRVVADAWDLRELRSGHEAFVERWARAQAPSEPPAALRMRLELVHDWRSFLFLDPGLPAALLPGDWLGDDAADAFARLYADLDAPSWDYYDALAAAAPLPLRHRPSASPFALGLDALSGRGLQEVPA